jgi:1-aminocyclopropane-1-carboxylate deaminase
MQKIDLTNITIDPVSLSLLNERSISCSVLRLDNIHTLISGNKWFKLRYYLEDAKKLGKTSFVTFGGAWSNHILATAAACQLHQLSCTGIIRGEEADTLSSTLVAAKKMGMQLVFVSREDYRQKKIPDFLKDDTYYLVDEGGYGIKGAEGASTILEYCHKEDYTHICCAVGTGTMMAGLINECSDHQQVIGISVLKNNHGAATAVQRLLSSKGKDPIIIHDHHFGGYAKHTPELLQFMNSFYERTAIPTDFVYTAKLCYAITDLISNNYFPSGSRLLIIHSGGLQGNDSLTKGTLIF